MELPRWYLHYDNSHYTIQVGEFFIGNLRASLLREQATKLLHDQQASDHSLITVTTKFVVGCFDQCRPDRSLNHPIEFLALLILDWLDIIDLDPKFHH